MKFFITGGAGFIGRNLVESLLLDDHEITIYENFSNSSEEKIQTFLDQGCKLVRGDLTNSSVLESSLKDHDFVIHLAAKIDILESIQHPLITNQVNVVGTINLLNACIKNNVKNIIGASSAAIYGNPLTLPVDENTIPNPVSPYGSDKISMEFYLRAFANAFNLNTISLRFFNVYGKGQSNSYAGVITKFFENIKKNEPLKIFGDGQNTRDYILINDLVAGIKLAINNIENKKGEVFNLASGQSNSVNHLAKLFLEISGKKLKIIHSNSRPGDLLFSEASILKAKAELGFEPKYDLKSGLLKFFKDME